MTIQICGKVSGLPIEQVWENFNKAERLLREKYPDMVIINPLKLCDPITTFYKSINAEPPYEFYMDVCLSSIKYIDILACLDDAHLSDGGKREMQRAWELGKEVKSLGDMLK